MKNSTKVRLHLSKNLFESLAKQVLAEAKKGDMSGGAYTEAVKQPKEKKEKKAPEVKATDKMKSMEEMETRVAETPENKKKKQVKEDGFAEPIQQLFNDPELAKTFGMSALKLLGSGATLAVAVAQGMKAIAKKAMEKEPEAFKGKTVDQVAREMGSSAAGKLQKTAGGTGGAGIGGQEVNK